MNWTELKTHFYEYYMRLKIWNFLQSLMDASEKKNLLRPNYRLYNSIFKKTDSEAKTWYDRSMLFFCPLIPIRAHCPTSRTQHFCPRSSVSFYCIKEDRVCARYSFTNSRPFHPCCSRIKLQFLRHYDGRRWFWTADLGPPHCSDTTLSSPCANRMRWGIAYNNILGWKVFSEKKMEMFVKTVNRACFFNVNSK